MKYHFVSVWLAKIKMCDNTKSWIFYLDNPYVSDTSSQDFVFLRETLANRQKGTSVQMFSAALPTTAKTRKPPKGYRVCLCMSMNTLCNCHAKE